MKRAALIILLLGFIVPALAQEQLSKRQLADRLFERYEYYKSLQLYLELAEKRNADVRLVERIAECYRLMNDNEHAEQWYATAISYTDANIDDIYFYAEELLYNQKIKEARQKYQLYYRKVNAPDEQKFKLATCDSAEKWMGASSLYKVANQKQWNSPYSDWGLNYYDAKQYVFTSDRIVDNNQRKQAKDARSGNEYYKLYLANGDSIRLLPLKIDNTVFRGTYDVGPMVVNSGGDTAYITITTTVPAKELPVHKTDGSSQRLYTRRLQLIIATKNNGAWGNYRSFPYNNVQEYSVGHAALSSNGNLIYFTSDMPGGAGKTDIWYCEKQADSSWGKPVNCGTTINTAQEEAFPTLHNQVLSFSSKGLPGMGGFDIFSATGEKASWSQPINLKYPLNSTSDDFHLIGADREQSGFFSSNRKGGSGSDDIYSYTYFSPPAKVIAVNPTRPDTTQLPAPQSAPSPQLPSALVAIIYYDLDKSAIRPDAAIELDQFISQLKAQPALRVVLASYTDSRASSAYNIELSRRRSASVVAYLVKHGIAKQRLIVRSYGEQHLVNQCADNTPCTEAEHQLNRRTELRVLQDKQF